MVFIRLNVSRHEMPASTRMHVLALETIVLFPRLPLASTETETAMFRSLAGMCCGKGVTISPSRHLSARSLTSLAAGC
jgi:hypothetical protein